MRSLRNDITGAMKARQQYPLSTPESQMKDELLLGEIRQYSKAVYLPLFSDSQA